MFLIFSVGLVSALDIIDNSDIRGVNIYVPTLPGFNNNTAFVNLSADSILWAGNAWSDSRWLNIDGGNANTNIDIGAYNISGGTWLGNWNGSSEYIPYTGATGNVDLGSNNITTTAKGTFGSVMVTDGDVVIDSPLLFGSFANTAGYIPFLSGNKKFSSDSRFFWDGISGQFITTDISINSDTGGVTFGDAQDKNIFANATGMFFNTLVGDTPYYFDNNLIITGNTNSSWFNGLFNWTTADTYNSFDGQLLTFNETRLNATIDSKIASIEYNASVISTLTGTLDSGNLASVQTRDNSFYNVSEVTGTPGWNIQLNYTGVVSFEKIIARFEYSGSSAHNGVIEFLDCGTELYETEFSFTDTDGIVSIISEVLDPTDHICGVDQNVSLQIRHTSAGNINHDIFIDGVHLGKGATSSSPSEVDPLSIHKSGDVALTGDWNYGSPQINGSGNITTEGNVTSDWIFFNYVGSVLSRINKGWFVEVDTAYLFVNQSDSTFGNEVAYFEQNDVSEEFLKFKGATENGWTKPVTSKTHSSFYSSSAPYGIKVTVNGAERWIRLWEESPPQ